MKRRITITIETASATRCGDCAFHSVSYFSGDRVCDNPGLNGGESEGLVVNGVRSKECIDAELLAAGQVQEEEP